MKRHRLVDQFIGQAHFHQLKVLFARTVVQHSIKELCFGAQLNVKIDFASHRQRNEAAKLRSRI